MRLEVIEDIARLATFESAWRALADGFPFRSPEWLLTWWKHFSTLDDRLHTVVVFDDEDCVRAVAPWYIHLPDGELRFLGDGIVCTDHMTVLVDSRFNDENPLEALAEHLIHAAGSRNGWRQLCFEAVDPLDRNMLGLRQALLKHGALLHTCRPANTWEVDLRNGWTAFLEGVSKNARKSFRRRAEGLEQVEVRWVSTPEDLEEFLPVLIELHQRRRQSLGDPGCFAEARFTAFLTEAARRFVTLGQLQAFSLWLDEKPISADIGFRSNDRWMCYQSGIDPDAMEHQPGKLANVYMLREAERQGIKVVDFLRGDEPYKQLLQANPKPVEDMLFAPPNWNGRVRHFLWRGSSQAKVWMKRFRQPG